MKKNYLRSFLLLIFLSAINLESFSQIITCRATNGTIIRNTPLIGFNTNAHLAANYPSLNYSGANWTQQWFIDSTAYIYPEILRYPGGLNSNHWDWFTGWFRPGYPTSGPLVTTRVEEFKPGKIASNANCLYVVNMETSNANYEMNGIRHANTIGMNLNLIELGNEHNLRGDSLIFPLQFMTSRDYAILAKNYYDSIKAVIPSSKVCAVGGNTNRRPDWLDSLFRYVPNIEAISWHVYTNADNLDLAFNVNRALAIPFGNSANIKSLLYRYNASGWTALPPNKEVWVTEYNLWEKQITTSTVISETWTHLLYVTAINHFFLTKPNITMIVNHSLASVDSYYFAISNFDKHISANGIAMKFLLDVSRGSQSSQDMAFSGNPTITYGTSIIPKLIGWKFNYSNSKKGFICNFSRDTFKVSLASVFTNPMQFTEYSADTNYIVKGLSGLRKHTGNSIDSVTIYPFSITQINSDQISNIQTQQTSSNNQLSFYQNQVQGNIILLPNIQLKNAEIVVYNLLGQELKTIYNFSGREINIPTTGFSRGIYLVKIKNNNQFVTGKFVLN